MTNRLAAEASPYLQQHAENPVDWFPWGDEAFDLAAELDRPVLLSVGYSACHWCHVMAHESFEDEATARLMNELFVNVKVDREERPDVDAVYMQAVQAMTGQGGWPMTVLLTPDRRPFFGGTYFPPTSRGGMIGFPELLGRVHELWRDRRAELLEQADALTAAIAEASATSRSESLPDLGAADGAAVALFSSYDAEWGGFGRAPKFPQAMAIDLLARVAASGGPASEDALEVVCTSLDAMASGGIYDHLGGGFARYSVDRTWLVPHFEKMLYDQALLVRAYLHGWQLTGLERYLQVVEETIGYVLRDLRSSEGAFFSAEDADSEGVEGRFYVWSADELARVAGDDGADPDAAAAALRWWGVTDGGNFEGSNILHRPERGDLERPAAVERARRRLFAARAQRVRPGLDDKVLVEWNALMIASLAEAGSATGRSDWVDAAREAADQLLARLRRDDGRWLRSWQPRRAGGDPEGIRSPVLAFSVDHAALLVAFLRLAEATGQRRWVSEAERVAGSMIELFWDPDGGGLLTNGRDAERLVAEPKDLMDNAVPSASSLAANGLLRLAAVTGDQRYADRAEAVMALQAEPALRHPLAFAEALSTMRSAAVGLAEVVVPGEAPALRQVVTSRFLPDIVLIWGEPWEGPAWEGRSPGFAYLCQGFRCLAPTSDGAELGRQIDELTSHPGG